MKTLLPLAFMVALATAPAAAAAKTLVSFERSGGIAGVSIAVAVSTTGHVTGDVHGGDRSHRVRAATLRHLRAWQQKAGDRFTLAEVVTRAEDVASLAAQFQSRLDAAATMRITAQSARQLNEAIMAIERKLVR